MKRKIFILGASGFVGKNLYEFLSKNKDYLVKGYSSEDCDLLSYECIENTLKDVSKNSVLVIVSSITLRKEDSIKAMIKNISMATNISSFLEKNILSHVIFISSVEVYGLVSEGNPINEKLLPAPSNFYGISKITSEYLLKKACKKKGTSLSILRFPGIYGKDDNGSVINILVSSAVNGKVTIFGDGEDKRDFVHIDDVCMVIDGCISNSVNDLINVATGKSYSINEIVSMIKSSTLSSFKIEYAKGKGADRIREAFYDIRLLGKHFPDLEFIGLEEGIQIMVNWKNVGSAKIPKT